MYLFSLELFWLSGLEVIDTGPSSDTLAPWGDFSQSAPSSSSEVITEGVVFTWQNTLTQVRQSARA